MVTCHRKKEKWKRKQNFSHLQDFVVELEAIQPVGTKLVPRPGESWESPRDIRSSSTNNRHLLNGVLSAQFLFDIIFVNMA